MPDDLMEKLTSLPRPDVSAATAERIRIAALARFGASAAERLWTERIELPATALIVAAYLAWAVLAAAA
ncbi:MAG: hypothetical protein ACYDCL_04925 [Myxococcales bacterium]